MMMTCEPFVNSGDRRSRERIYQRETLPIDEESVEFIPTRSALDGSFTEYDVKPDSNSDYSIALRVSLKSVGRLIKQLIIQHKSSSYYIEFDIVMQKTLIGHEDKIGLWTKTTKFLSDDEVEPVIDRYREKIEKAIDEFVCNDSGWTFVNFTNISVHVTRYTISIYIR